MVIRIRMVIVGAEWGYYGHNGGIRSSMGLVGTMGLLGAEWVSRSRMGLVGAECG